MQNFIGTLIDNTSVDNTRLYDFSVIPIVNGLSDHSGQYLILKNVFTMIKSRSSTSRTRLLCKDSIPNFLELLTCDSWGNLYEIDFVQDTFKSFLHTFLITF
jgi:hypothetical protein